MGVRRGERLAREAASDYKYSVGDEVCIKSMRKSGIVTEQTYQFPGQKAYWIQLDDGSMWFATERQLGPLSECAGEQISLGFMKDAEWLGMVAALVIVGAIAFMLSKQSGLRPRLA